MTQCLIPLLKMRDMLCYCIQSRKHTYIYTKEEIQGLESPSPNFTSPRFLDEFWYIFQTRSSYHCTGELMTRVASFASNRAKIIAGKLKYRDRNRVTVQRIWRDVICIFFYILPSRRLLDQMDYYPSSEPPPPPRGVGWVYWVVYASRVFT
jgi:hypothetical protein